MISAVSLDLRDELDAIDHEVVASGRDAMLELHRLEKLAMLRKGRAVLERYPGLGESHTRGSVTFADVATETGRRNVTIKKWVDLVRRVAPAVADRTDECFEEAARDLAERQAQKWEQKVLPSAESTEAPVELELVSTGEPPWDVILADPPWSYDDKATSGGHWAGAENHYGCMSIEQLCDMTLNFGGASYTVADVAADDAELWLWTTWPFLQASFAVMEAWGFTYKTLGFIWTKTNADGTPYMGLGNGTRIGSEPCLRCVKGKGLKRVDAGVNSDIRCPRTGHSAKPFAQYEKLEQLYGPQRRLEIFARTQRQGWDVYGNQVQQEIPYGL